MKSTAAAFLIACLAATGATAAPKGELSKPVVMFTGVIKKNADALGLTEEQKADLAQWIATKPAVRKKLEQEAIALRAQLRQKIIEGAPREERLELARKIGDAESRLVMMRSDCTDHWRAVLTPEQFEKMLELAGYR